MTPEPQGPGRKHARRRETTRQSILRFKEIVQRRLADVHGELGKEREEVDASESHSKMRAADLLGRTLHKVIELERKERASRTARAKHRRLVSPSRREELAKRIEELGRLGPVETGGGRSDA